MVKKVVECFSEFTLELYGAIPYAYWLYKHDMLKKTISCKDTKCFYYFSPNHKEKYDKRWWDYPATEKEKGWSQYQNINIEGIVFDRQWLLPPYKEVYSGLEDFNFNKPLLVITNKCNSEWGHVPIHYFSAETLAILFENLKDKYQIIYNRPFRTIIMDNSSIFFLPREDETLEAYPEVVTTDQLYQEWKYKYTFNHLQLKLYANCNKFISVVGGAAALCTLFGGTIIVQVRYGELHNTNAYRTWMPKISGSNIIPVEDLWDKRINNQPNDFKLIDKVMEKYL